MQQVNSAISAGTWPTQPAPHLYAWGQNNNGALGLGNLTNYSSPKQVGSLTAWLVITSGYNYVVSIKTDGTLWAWGKNNYGQLGTGNITNYSSPIQVGALTTWSKVSASKNASNWTMAIKTDGTLWSWGYNSYGGLGLGNITKYSSPKQVGALTNWSQISGAKSGSFVASIKTDGTLWSWGVNNYGQLGSGNIIYYSSPKQVGSLTTWQKVSCGNTHTVAIG
jgi:alpha-tubulin suppressor-like RCC1 family protein